MHIAIIVLLVAVSIVSLGSPVLAQPTVTLTSPLPGSIQGVTSFCLTWAAAGNPSNVTITGPYQDTSGGAVNCYAWKDTGWVENPPGHWEPIDSADGFGWAQYYPQYGRGWTSVSATAHKMTFAASAAYAQSGQFEVQKRGKLQGTFYWVSHANLSVEGNEDPIDTFYVESVSKLKTEAKTEGTTDGNMEATKGVNGKVLDRLVNFLKFPDDSQQAIQKDIDYALKGFTKVQEPEEFYHLEVTLQAEGKFTVSSSAAHLCDPKKLAGLELIEFNKQTQTIPPDSIPSRQAKEPVAFQSEEGIDNTQAVLEACPEATDFVKPSAFKVKKSDNVPKVDQHDHPVVLSVHKPFRNLIFVPFDTGSEPPRETVLSLGQATRVREINKPGAKQ